MSNEGVRAGRIDAFILLADKAERLIGEALARVAGSDAPKMDEAYGEINMAYRLELIDYPRRAAMCLWRSCGKSSPAAEHNCAKSALDVFWERRHESHTRPVEGV